jgi:alpha-beta hydrolase superfamily lysophospholipase
MNPCVRWTIAGLALLLGASCAGQKYVSGLRQPLLVGQQVTHREGRFEDEKGLSFFEESWKPATGQAKAVLIIMHGLKDHADRYSPLAERLVAEGYAVYAFDLRGHGDSEGPRVWVDRFDDYVDDLGRFVARVRAQEAGKPLFLFGHSMGGAISTLYALRPDTGLRGLILSAPALKPPKDVSGFVQWTTRFLSALTPTLAVLDLKDESFCRDPKVVAEMKADPLIYHQAGPARTAGELFGAMYRIDTESPKLTVPLLALHGKADQLTDPDGSVELVLRAGSSDKRLKLYPLMVHDLVHEPERAEVIGDIVAWMNARVATPPAHASSAAGSH